METNGYLGKNNGTENSTLRPATLFTVFLPLNANNGRRMQSARFNQAQNEILNFAGGLTQFRPAKGLWIDQAETVYRDLVLPVQVAIPPGLEAEIWFAHWAAKMAYVLEQAQIFVLSQEIYLIESLLLRQPIVVGGGR